MFALGLLTCTFTPWMPKDEICFTFRFVFVWTIWTRTTTVHFQTACTFKPRVIVKRNRATYTGMQSRSLSVSYLWSCMFMHCKHLPVCDMKSLLKQIDTVVKYCKRNKFVRMLHALQRTQLGQNHSIYTQLLVTMHWVHSGRHICLIIKSNWANKVQLFLGDTQILKQKWQIY